MQHGALSIGVMIAGVVVLLGALLGSGCAEESQEAVDDRAALALLADVMAADYRAWPTMPGFEERRTSTGPHGQAVEIYANRLLADAVDSGGPWPSGSVAVKDGYIDDELAVRAIAHRDEQGWFFAQFDGEARIIAAGRSIYCLDCHSAGRGYLLSPPEPVPEPEPDYRPTRTARCPSPESI